MVVAHWSGHWQLSQRPSQALAAFSFPLILKYSLPVCVCLCQNCEYTDHLCYYIYTCKVRHQTEQWICLWFVSFPTAGTDYTSPHEPIVFRVNGDSRTCVNISISEDKLSKEHYEAFLIRLTSTDAPVFADTVIVLIEDEGKGHIPYIGDCNLPRAKILKKLHAVEIEWVCEKNRVYIYDVFKYHLTTNTFALIRVLSQHKTIVIRSNSNDCCQQKDCACRQIKLLIYPTVYMYHGLQQQLSHMQGWPQNKMATTLKVQK